jgi:acyl carrier protein
MSKKVLEIVASIMGVPAESVTEASTPETLRNWDSLRHMKLILAVEESLGIEFSDEDIVAIRDVRGLIARTEAKRGGNHE